MYFEVVTHRTLREGIKYHGRCKLDDSHAVIWRTELYDKKEHVYTCIRMLAEAANAPIVEIDE
jgi:uncharacterized protein YegP (UPF0339 family)